MNKKEMLSMILKLEKHKLSLNLVIIEYYNKLDELSYSIWSQKSPINSAINSIREEKTTIEETIKKEVEQADSPIGCAEAIVWLLIFISILAVIFSNIDVSFGGVILAIIIDLIVSSLIIVPLDSFLSKVYDNKTPIEGKYNHDLNDVNKRLEAKEKELKNIEYNHNKLYENVKKSVIHEIVNIQTLIDRIDYLLSEYYTLCSFLNYNYQSDLLVISALYHFIENHSEANDDNIIGFLNDIDTFKCWNDELAFMIQREVTEINKKYSQEIMRIMEIYIKSNDELQMNNKHSDIKYINHGDELCKIATSLLKK